MPLKFSFLLCKTPLPLHENKSGIFFIYLKIMSPLETKFLPIKTIKCAQTSLHHALNIPWASLGTINREGSHLGSQSAEVNTEAFKIASLMFFD